jgi:MraZ protein
LTFRGTFEYALDAKHRLTVPAKYRAALAGGVVLAFSPETEMGSEMKSLSIWPAEAYDSYAQDALTGINPLSPKARDLRRVLYNNSWELELDSANRLMIPGPAMGYAGLAKEVVITGSGECLEVWDRAAHSKYNEGVLARFPEIAASFDHTN